MSNENRGSENAHDYSSEATTDFHWKQNLIKGSIAHAYRTNMIDIEGQKIKKRASEEMNATLEALLGKGHPISDSEFIAYVTEELLPRYPRLEEERIAFVNEKEKEKERKEKRKKKESEKEPVKPQPIPNVDNFDETPTPIDYTFMDNYVREKINEGRINAKGIPALYDFNMQNRESCEGMREYFEKKVGEKSPEDSPEKGYENLPDPFGGTGGPSSPGKPEKPNNTEEHPNKNLETLLGKEDSDAVIEDSDFIDLGEYGEPEETSREARSRKAGYILQRAYHATYDGLKSAAAGIGKGFRKIFDRKKKGYSAPTGTVSESDNSATEEKSSIQVEVHRVEKNEGTKFQRTDKKNVPKPKELTAEQLRNIYSGRRRARISLIATAAAVALGLTTDITFDAFDIGGKEPGYVRAYTIGFFGSNKEDRNGEKGTGYSRDGKKVEFPEPEKLDLSYFFGNSQATKEKVEFPEPEKLDLSYFFGDD